MPRTEPITNTEANFLNLKICSAVRSLRRLGGQSRRWVTECDSCAGRAARVRVPACVCVTVITL